MSQHPIIALLGRPDQPTDAVEEYCRYLGQALQAHGYDLKIERVGWPKRGWASALRSLRRHARAWRHSWVLVQYTALAWSKRGLPLRFPQVLKRLKAAGARVAVVFHDVEPFAGNRWIDRLRRVTQVRVMREVSRLADVTIFTVPMEKLSWLKGEYGKATFIPVGANFPASGKATSRMGISGDEKLYVAVFGITGGKVEKQEVEEIAGAVRFAASRVKNLCLVVLGRNSREAEPDLRKALADCGVELEVLGVLPAEGVVRCLSVSDVLLFVRGHISTRRSSAIAGIACGLPVVAFEGPETAPPVTEAGLALYSPQRKGHLGEVLVHVLQDEHYRAELAQRSWLAQQQYFSWTAIAARYAEVLQKQP